MCFHSRQSKDAQTLEKRFDALLHEPERTAVMSADFNAFTHPRVPVITREKPSLIQLYEWGLIPAWAKDTELRKHTLNARIETLTELPSFRQAEKNRCLVLADGFYEWHWNDPKGKSKTRYLITLPDEEPFALAGIYSHWTDKSTGEVLHTFSIVTTAADPFMAEIHNNKLRMPVVLTRENEREWLRGDDNTLFRTPAVTLTATERKE